MRGKPSYSMKVLQLLRITPADAGKTSGWREVWQKEWDHPRGCGENPVLRLLLRTLLGSPPRMRGKRDNAD